MFEIAKCAQCGKSLWSKTCSPMTGWICSNCMEKPAMPTKQLSRQRMIKQMVRSASGPASYKADLAKKLETLSDLHLWELWNPEGVPLDPAQSRQLFNRTIGKLGA